MEFSFDQIHSVDFVNAGVLLNPFLSGLNP